MSKNITDISEIPMADLGVSIGPDSTETRRKFFNYYSNFLNLYCNVKKENLQAKTNLFILKLYNFIKNKVDSYLFETIVDIPDDDNFSPLLRGKPKGFKFKYIISIGPVFLFIIFSSNFSENVKKDIACSVLLINSEPGAYDPINDIIDASKIRVPFDSKKQFYSLNEFRNLFYDNVIVDMLRNIKVIDQDILNYNICE